MSEKIHIGFICSGNICRSPYAAAKLAQLAHERGWHGKVVTSSAGTLGLVDHPAHELTQRLATEESLDLAEHRSQPVTGPYVDGCDLLLGLAREHVALLRRLYPAAADRVLLLSAYPEPGLEGDDVVDPIGQEEPVFRLSHQQIRSALDRLVAHLDSLL